MRKRIFGYILAITASVSVIGMSFAATDPQRNTAYLAVIIDDFGYNGEGTAEILDLDIPLTAAIMPFSEKAEENCLKVKEAGKEAIIHLPMESKTGKKSWVGTKGIFTDMNEEEIKQTVNDALDIVDTAVGLNNHMGSAIMEDEKKLDAVMQVLSERNMVFIDSLTTVDSKGEKSAKKYDVDYLKRTVFIDSPGNTDVIINRLKKAAEYAEKNGYAIAIGHVGPAGGKTTAEAIKCAKENIEKMGVKFVTVSELNKAVNG